MRPRVKIRSRIIALLAAAATTGLVPLVMPTVAHAAVEQSVETYFVRGNPPAPTLAQLQSRLAARHSAGLIKEDDQAQVPLETVGPAASWAPKTSRPAVTPRAGDRQQPALAAGVSYPEPARSMSLKECQDHMGPSDVMYIKSRFAVCTSLQADQVWIQNGTPVGMSTLTLFIRGTVPKESDRTMYFDYDITNFRKDGKTGTAALTYTIEPKFPMVSPAKAQVQNGGPLPLTLTWDELSTRRPTAHFEHTARVAPGQGSGSGYADAVFAAYQPVLTSHVPPGWQGTGSSGSPFMMAPRWDAAKYLRNSTGQGNPDNRGSAAFSVVTPLKYSKADGAPEQGVALHIEKAFTDPNHTVPPTPEGKKIPGQVPGSPLHRLLTDNPQYDRNRIVAVQNCNKYWSDGYTEGGTKECDEFPFASTYEGSAQSEYDPHAPKGNFSVLPVPKTQNRDAGTILKAFYMNNRIIEGLDDGFTVNVTGEAIEHGGLLINSSKKCLEIENSSEDNGARAQQWDCNGQPGADWLVQPTDDGQYVNIVNANSGKCLEIVNSRTDNGAPAQQYDCVGIATQKWQMQGNPGNRIIRNVNSGKVLEVENSSAENGARVQQWDNSGQPGAVWTQG
ncbi:RICIN domain-containing protein [Streptomyces sp. NPDC001262]|uniref:RICIN domain-containing protein n=1 Tax=Streptomyces sp. NPDC001262 TaxID=3364552 RepID=UPI0036AB2260